jgi:hypothetical protein
VFRAQEDGGGRRLHQARARAHQGERRPHRADPPGDAPPQGFRAHHARRPHQVQGRRHAHPRPRRRQDVADLRHPPGHRQGARRLLPEVRRRGRQEGGQGHLRPLRPHPPRRRPQALRAQEVWWTWSPRQVPEVIPLIGELPDQSVCWCPIDGPARLILYLALLLCCLKMKTV